MKTKIQSRLMVVFLSFLVCLAFVPMAAFAVEYNTEPGTDATVEESAQGTDEETENPDGDQVDQENPDGEEENSNQPEKKVLTVKVDPNGGNWKGKTDIISNQVPYGEIYVLPEAPTKDGYTFVGWFDSDLGKDASKIVPGEKYQIIINHTFKAMWKKNDATPNTGDNAMPYVYALGLLTAASAMFVLRAKKAK